VTAALAAVRLEPLREGAHRTLIQSHLAERNLVEALRHYYRMKSLLSSELGVQPARQLTKLLAAHGLAE
jgi:DNA-binding SARP family transcriptional activator